MSPANKTIFSLHRVTGTVIALFFLMWFVTGLVLIYKGYPRLDAREARAHMESLPATLPAPDVIPDSATDITVRQFQGQTLLSYSVGDTDTVVSADSAAVRKVDFNTCAAVARRWVNAPVSRVDTLRERRQWVLYSRYERQLPIYRFHFDDGHATQLYLASKTAEPLQLTDRSSRFWAWMGAIPHKLYFPCIRKDVDTWKFWITLGASLCLLASLTGVYAGIYVWRKHKRASGRWSNPFREKWLRWHFAIGMVFAIPLVAWSVSGIFSMQRVPKWLVPMEGDYFFDYSTMWGKGTLPLADYMLDYRTLSSTYPDLKQVEWGRYGGIPVYTVTSGDSETLVDASGPHPKELVIPESEVLAGMRRLHGDKADIRIETLDHYDNLYYSVDGDSPLPVYRVTVANADRDLYYVDPRSGHVTYLNTNKIWRKFLFSGIHYLNLRCFAGHETIWHVCIWLVCVTGAAFCIDSVWLGVRYIRRKLTRKSKH